MSILDEKIEKSKTIAILGHMNADGDCVGSQLSLYNYILKKYPDKKPKVYILRPSKRFSFLKNFDKISEANNDAEIYDLAVFVDAGTLERMEKDFHNYFNTAIDKLIIDHHETKSMDIEDKYIHPEAPANCELMYKLMDKEYIDKDIAECLYLGLATDTGVFRYSSTTHETMDIAGKLMDMGIDFTNILDKAIFINSLNQRRAQAIAFNNAKYICKGNVMFSYILKNELDELDLGKEDIDNIVVYLREMERVKVAVFAYPIGYNIYKLSLRSNSDDYNVAQYATLHDGGGHIRAAGCAIKADIKKVEEIVSGDMLEFFKFEKAI